MSEPTPQSGQDQVWIEIAYNPDLTQIGTRKQVSRFEANTLVAQGRARIVDGPAEAKPKPAKA